MVVYHDDEATKSEDEEKEESEGVQQEVCIGRTLEGWEQPPHLIPWCSQAQGNTLTPLNASEPQMVMEHNMYCTMHRTKLGQNET